MEFIKWCDTCGTKFTAQRNRAKYCSTPCRWNRKRSNVCKECGLTFIGAKGVRHCVSCQTAIAKGVFRGARMRMRGALIKNGRL